MHWGSGRNLQQAEAQDSGCRTLVVAACCRIIIIIIRLLMSCVVSRGGLLKAARHSAYNLRRPLNPNPPTSRCRCRVFSPRRWSPPPCCSWRLAATPLFALVPSCCCSKRPQLQLPWRLLPSRQVRSSGRRALTGVCTGALWDSAGRSINNTRALPTHMPTHPHRHHRLAHSCTMHHHNAGCTWGDVRLRSRRGRASRTRSRPRCSPRTGRSSSWCVGGVGVKWLLRGLHCVCRIVAGAGWLADNVAGSRSDLITPESLTNARTHALRPSRRAGRTRR